MPPNSNVELPTPGTSEQDLVWKYSELIRGHAVIERAPNTIWLCSYKKGRFWHIDRQTQGVQRVKMKAEARWWVHKPKKANDCQQSTEATKMHGTVLGRKQSCQNLDLGLLAPRNVRQYMSAIYYSDYVWCFVIAALAN